MEWRREEPLPGDTLAERPTLLADTPPRNARRARRPAGGLRHHLWCFIRQWSATHALWGGLAVLWIVQLWSGADGSAWIAGSALGLAVLPAAIEGLTRVWLPRGFVLGCGLFTVLAIALGEMGDFYQRVEWWDVALHAWSGFALGLLGGTIVLTLLSRSGAKPGILLVGLFASHFAFAWCMLWELFEFSLDARFGFSTQIGLVDTMHDMAWGALGGVLATLLVVAHLAGRAPNWFSRLLDDAVRMNGSPGSWSREP